MRAILASLVVLGMIVLIVQTYRMDMHNNQGDKLKLPKKKR